MTDTSPEIAEMVRTRLMALTGAQRMRMGSEMFDAARRMAIASLPKICLPMSSTDCYFSESTASRCQRMAVL